MCVRASVCVCVCVKGGVREGGREEGERVCVEVEGILWADKRSPVHTHKEA